jgi:Tol biopolymer transport system component
MPTATPDGGRIAFAVTMTELGSGRRVDDIFAVDRNGLNMKQLTTADGVDDMPRYAPRGNLIAYRRYTASPSRGDIWLMAADGTNRINLTDDLAGTLMIGEPAWSPDGTRIAFVTRENVAAGTTTSIWTMRADGSDKRRITETLIGFDALPSWSADGRHIAFVRSFVGETDIAIVPSGGGEVQRLLLPGNQSAPAWSPDGRLIAFENTPFGQRTSIQTMRPDGTDIRTRTEGFWPQWIAR